MNELGISFDKLGHDTSPSPKPAAWSSAVAAFEVLEVSTSLGSAAFSAGLDSIAALALSGVAPESLAAAAAPVALVVLVASSTSSSEHAIANRPNAAIATITSPNR
ncbi:hypothetical protein OAK52_03525, partial [Chloroflexi bacterium]|nr:hypothetical protein [Chloroflexota bacterium]